MFQLEDCIVDVYNIFHFTNLTSIYNYEIYYVLNEYYKFTQVYLVR